MFNTNANMILYYSMNEPIQMLWIGEEMHETCVACISSFLDHGHKVHLYVYGDIETPLPEGITLKDGREVLPEEDVFLCQTEPGKGSPSPFSDYFRWKLLYERGGWWVDTDVACVQPWTQTNILAGESSYIFVGDRPEWGEHYATCVMHMEKGGKLAESCYNYCVGLDKSQVTWTQPAIDILNENAGSNGWADPKTFCPVAWTEWEKLYQENFEFGSETYGVHIWNEMRRRSGPVEPRQGSFIQRLLDDSSRRSRRRQKLNAH